MKTFSSFLLSVILLAAVSTRGSSEGKSRIRTNTHTFNSGDFEICSVFEARLLRYFRYSNRLFACFCVLSAPSAALRMCDCLSALLLRRCTIIITVVGARCF